MKDKMLTVRLPIDLDAQVTEQARKEDLSKNQLIKKAVRLYLEGASTAYIQQRNKKK